MRSFLAVLCAGLATACAAQPKTPSPSPAASPAQPAAREPFSSTYKASPSPVTLIRNATVLTGTGMRIDGGDVLIEGGRIKAVGTSLAAPEGAVVVDANGRWVTPGIIDVHSHLGVYASPGTHAADDGNEATDPVTSNAWAEHSIWPQDPGFETALQGGVTSMQILPGSANLIGGRGVTIKNVPATTYQAMKFPGAPQGLKMACGENPKRVYGDNDQFPSTRMGNVAGYRQAFADAKDYMEDWKEYDAEVAKYEKEKADGDKDAVAPKPPKRDLKLETLAEVMRGHILVHNHCYRADEMATMLDIAQEFGFKISAFHHGVEAYKLADRLAKEGVCGALWADWWGFKMEAYDGIQENIAIVDHPEGGCAIVHSDSEEGIQRLNQEAAKAMTRGIRAGFDIPPERAIRWITANPAKALGILDQTGTLEAGKMGDVVIWNGTPFSVYALADEVFVDGVMLYDRTHPAAKPRSDFSL
ncbi:MAG TPA: amidohydrolase [Steroidobacteraceae bacterium]|jgi:imidazolonepropionase-like amidohydrolase|nr:amidohydrolase [Steroidobacteraceae bacterium]